MSVSCYGRLDYLEILDLLDCLDFQESLEKLLDDDLAGCGLAVDIDAHEINSRFNTRDIDAVTTIGPDHATIEIEQFNALDVGVGTGDNVVAVAFYLQASNGNLIDAARLAPDDIIQFERSGHAHQLTARL